VVATDFIYFAASRGEQVPYKGVLFILSSLAIISSAIYDYSPKGKRET